MLFSESFSGLKLDDPSVPVTAWRPHVSAHDIEVPVHKHSKGQLTIALHGAVTCWVKRALWIVPPGGAVWIPSNMLHRNMATANARLCYLFVEPSVGMTLPECCSFSVSVMVKEMILRLAEQGTTQFPTGHMERLSRVLIDELSMMKPGQLSFPLTDHPKIRMIAEQLQRVPYGRITIAQWAVRLGMTERSLARLIEQEVGLSFGKWRQKMQLLIAIRQIASGEAVHNVASDLGYETVTAFIKMFKKAMGSTPSNYVL